VSNVVAFRPLERSDFQLLGGWLAEPLVRRWWNHETSPAAVERDFGPSVDGADVAEFFLALTASRPFGLIQRYPLAAYPEYGDELAALLPVAPGAMSIDYLIGDPACRGRGLGAAMIAAFVARLWPEHPGATQVIVPVAAGNRGSWRALERAGFTRVAEGELEPDNPADPRDHVVYALARPSADRGAPAQHGHL
jgi:aminoglycoside 6'-N-acetyltransferase